MGGYFIYGKYIEKVFNPDDRPTPATTLADWLKIDQYEMKKRLYLS
ncbi:MAG: hypothetical protein RR324_08515 [Cellulosilyticaceae bacterium]